MNKPSLSRVFMSAGMMITGGLIVSALVGSAPIAEGQGFTVLPGARPISSLPFTIGNCGSYFLTSCLTGSPGSDGITVTADDVTIDLNGFHSHWRCRFRRRDLGRRCKYHCPQWNGAGVVRARSCIRRPMPS